MNDQPVDVFLKQITYLPFTGVVSLCSTNKKFNNYCTNYPNRWQSLIDDTFSHIYDYQDKLDEIWTKLNMNPGTYNYIVYTNLIKLLDPITQLMIYHKQGDDDMFNSERYTESQRFLTLFLLGDNENIKKHIPGPWENFPYYLFLSDINGKTVHFSDKNTMLGEMAKNGSIQGVNYFLTKGAGFRESIPEAAREGREDMVRYLLKLGVIDISYKNEALLAAAESDNMRIVKLLIENGANPNISLENVSDPDIKEYLISLR